MNIATPASLWLGRAQRDMRRLVLSFTVTGAPKTKGSLKPVGGHRLVEQVKGSTAWGSRVEDAAKTAMLAEHHRIYGGFPAGGRPLGFPLDEPVVVELIVTVPALKTATHRWPFTKSSGDLDKHQRNVGDALTGHCGTPNGYRIHAEQKIPRCTPCRIAWRAYARERYAARAKAGAA